MQMTVKDIPVYYEIHGSGTPVLMIHGWSPDHRLMKGCMEPVFQAVQQPYQRIYFDLPGMGKTPGRPWITGSDAMLEIIFEFVDSILPNQHFLLAGESYGGYLARGFIHERPQWVDGLLLICPSKTPFSKEGRPVDPVPEFQVFEKDPALLARLSPRQREMFTGINVIQNERVWQRFSNEILGGLELADYEFLNQSLGQDVPFHFALDQLKQPFTRPSLFVMGRQDSAVGYRAQWEILENYPRASFVVLDKAGHNLQIEQDVLFTELVKEWLTRVQDSRGTD